ncbi:MAG: alpha/beta fold hydrolase [Sulfuricaulis sp.]
MSKIRALIHFPGALGDRLAARLDLPVTPPAAFALFAHCFTCSKDSLAASRISAALTDNGLGVLRFDFTGLGASEGDFANTNFSSNVADLVAAASWLREHHQAPRILVGHSLGGAAVLAAAEQIPESAAVSTIGAPYDPAHVRRLLEGVTPEIEAAGAADVTIAGRKFRIKQQFLDDISSQNSNRYLAHLRKALLIFHSPRDTTVSIENAGMIFAAAKHPKSFISLDDADHLLTRKEDALYVASVLASWASRYVKPAPPPGCSCGSRRGDRQRNAGEQIHAIDRRRRSSSARRRAGKLWRHRYRSLALRFAAGESRRLHVHDAASVCRSEKLAVGACHSASQA